MTNGEQVTGTRDEHYNLVSALYHTLQEGDTIQRYIDEAEQANDSELADFFRQVQDEDRQRAARKEPAAQAPRVTPPAVARMGGPDGGPAPFSDPSGAGATLT